MQNISIVIAFTGGLLSFFSPCVLPLLPAYISLITGSSIEELQQHLDENKQKFSVLIRILFFILGFSFVFIILGLGSTYIGNFLLKNNSLIRTIGGIIIILFGLHVSGIINIKFLLYEKKIHIQNHSINILSSFFMGIVFSIGWTPCIGPILASILTIAATKTKITEGIILLTSYSIGLGIPFILTGIFLDFILKKFKQITKYLKFISIASGILLIIIGIFMIINPKH
jgi:cytochrome c-type biogenesis protein